MISRLAYAALVGLVGAGIVHIAVLMMLPSFSERDAWSKLAGTADPYTVVRVAGEAAPPSVLQSGDPFFDAVACRFDLGEGIAHLTAEGATPFWSVSIYNRNGQNIYSFNDRSAADGLLDFVIATPIQVTEVRKNLPPEFEKSVFVEADIGEGIVVVRSFVPDESWKPQITSYLNGISCRTVDRSE